MKIGFIGAGKAGCSIGKYLSEEVCRFGNSPCNGVRDKGSEDYTLAGFYSRTYESAKWAAEFTKSRAYDNLKDLVLASDTLMIGVPDGEIKPVWDCIADILREAKKDSKCRENLHIDNVPEVRAGEGSFPFPVVCHFSGSLSSDVFFHREEFGIKACSIHPMYPFSSKSTSYLQLNKVVFTVEGDNEACELLENIFKGKGNIVRRIDSSSKAKYHAAASILSNSVLALLDLGLELLGECGFSKDEAFKAAAPLVENNIKGFLENGVMEALTGPIERADLETVRGHLNVLNENKDAAEIYRLLGKRLVRISKEKHPDRDYREMAELLEK